MTLCMEECSFGCDSDSFCDYLSAFLQVYLPSGGGVLSVSAGVCFPV